MAAHLAKKANAIQADLEHQAFHASEQDVQALSEEELTWLLAIARRLETANQDAAVNAEWTPSWRR